MPPEQAVLAPPVRRPELSAYASEKLRQIVVEVAKRRCEALKLYEPMELQEKFHASTKPERLLRGSNRGGKTLPAAVEVARAVSGKDKKYPATGRVIAVGKDLRHIGQTMWRKLRHAGAFKMIRDRQTGLWRAYRPWVDNYRAHEAKLAPPLIPQRLIKSIAWHNKKENQPSLVTLTTGWEILFCSGEGEPPQGSDVDLVWFDEEIPNEEWYSEMAMRLLDRDGKFIWSATPQAATQQLFDLHTRFVDGDELVEEFHIKLHDNTHLSLDAKRKVAAKLTPEEARVRIEGEFALTAYKVYNEYHKLIHNCDPFDIPGDWMRIVSIDPGRQVCAGLFAAIPPPYVRDPHVYLYEEFYLKAANATMFGEAMERRTRGQGFRVFLIDGNAARQGEMASGRTVQGQYRDALKNNNVSSELTGHDFKWGCDEVAAGISAFRSMMLVTPDGTPRLRVFRNRLPYFEWEIDRYHYQRGKGGIITDKPEQKNNHLMDCGRYIALYDLTWHKPRPAAKRKSPALRALEQKRAWQRERRRAMGIGPSVRLGPGGGPYGTE